MPLRNRLFADRLLLRLRVDPISNTIAITSANPLYAALQSGSASDLEIDWGKAIAEGVLSDSLLAPILHELTHHSSLQTPVGQSLSALALSHTSFFGKAAKDTESLTGPARDIILNSAANLYLRPLLEGMSLFQEFDAISGDVPLATWASQVGGLLFTGDQLPAAILAGRDVTAPLKEKLEGLRLTSNFISRKKDLLRRGLDDSEGYLLGYLLVKLIWHDLMARNKVWRNSDMFLMFINDYFFSDYNLALHLVDSMGAPIDETLRNLKDYLLHRFLYLSANAQQFGGEFLEYYLGDQRTRPSYQGFDDSVMKRLNVEWTIRTLRSLHYNTPDFMSGRTIPRILAAPAKVTIDKKGRFNASFADGSLPFHGTALAAARAVNGRANEGDGSVEAVVLLPQNGRRQFRFLICVFLDRDLVATFDPKTKEFNDKDAATTCDKLGSYLSYESFAVQVEEELPPKEDTNRLNEYLNRYTGQAGVNEMIDMWVKFALVPDIDKDENPTVKELLKRDGFGSLLGLNSFALSRLASLSLKPLESGTQGFPLTADDKDWIVDLNSRSREILGFSLFFIKDGNLMSSRI